MIYGTLLYAPAQMNNHDDHQLRFNNWSFIIIISNFPFHTDDHES